MYVPIPYAEIILCIFKTKYLDIMIDFHAGNARMGMNSLKVLIKLKR